MFNRALIIFFLFECIFAQATSVLPIGRADGTHNSSGIPDGYYNINARDSNSGNGGFRLAHSSFVSGGQWKLQVSNDGSTWVWYYSGWQDNPGTSFNVDLDQSTLGSKVTFSSGQTTSVPDTSLRAGGR